jgi:hypothetical protein
MPRRLSRGEFFARQKQEAWDRARAHRERDARETADTLIKDRGLANARAWAIHCANRSTDGFWSRVVMSIEAIDEAEQAEPMRERRIINGEVWIGNWKDRK